MTTRGARRHLVTLQNPTATPDGDGGFQETWAPLTPASMKAEILPATARDLERVFIGTVTATASYIVTIDHHPQVTHRTRLLFGARTFAIEGIANPEERSHSLILACSEAVV